MREEASQQGAEAAEPEQECKVQDLEPGGPHPSENCVTFSKYNVQSKRTAEEASHQAMGTAETEQGKEEEKVVPTETESSSQRLPADLNLTSFKVKMGSASLTL